MPLKILKILKNTTSLIISELSFQLVKLVHVRYSEYPVTKVEIIILIANFLVLTANIMLIKNLTDLHFLPNPLQGSTASSLGDTINTM